VPTREALEEDHRERRAGSALLLAESKFHRVKGYKEIPNLLTVLADHGMKAIKKDLPQRQKPHNVVGAKAAIRNGGSFTQCR
jgi:hypothetical protein